MNVWAAISSPAADMRKTKKISICAVLSALGVVILYLGSFIEVLDMSVACIASLIIMFCVAELGYAAALSVYAVISIISFLILPSKWVAVFFVFFFGLMPITKSLYEKTGAVLSWILKIATFNATLFGFYFVSSALGFFENNEITLILFAVVFIAANFVFVLTDILYGRLYTIYELKYRSRIRKFLK